MNIRARRTAQVRTRLKVDRILTRVLEIAEDPKSTGWTMILGRGRFTGGLVGDGEFSLDYYINYWDHEQMFEVRGKIDDTMDWRVVRLDVRAHEPWMSGWLLVILAAAMGFWVYTDQMAAGQAATWMGAIVAFFGFANLLILPDAVKDRVTQRLASALGGSLLRRGEWVAPG